ncbi:MAG TPA: HNH endonuclease [Flavipsychrobacter sp.]|nr:HNH endonuclease [Flavipsychrobacter sp.]
MTVFYTLPELCHVLEEFQTIYTYQTSLTIPNAAKASLKHYKERTCRFCSKKYPSTSFMKEAHILPFFLGNRYGLSEFECDNCNSHFSRFENDLAKYLGVEKSINGSISRNGIPTTKSQANDIEARSATMLGVKGRMIQLTDLESDSLEIIDSEDGEDTLVKFKFVKQSYIPAFVYKSLLKIALSALPLEETKYYSNAFSYLLDSENKKWKGFQSLMIFKFPITPSFVLPFGRLFKKKDESISACTHQFSLYYQNLVLSFGIPFHIADIQNGLYDGKSYSFPICPPLSVFPLPIGLKVESQNLDLSSYEIVKGEKEEIVMKSKKIDPNLMASIDHETGEVSPSKFNIEKIKGIFLYKSDQELKITQVKKNDKDI